jgi:hypothetical protein
MDSAFLQEFKEEADILEENAVQILNCSITKHANSQVLNVFKFTYFSNNSFRTIL